MYLLNYLNNLSMEEFEDMLSTYDIVLSKKAQILLLSTLENNIYALNDTNYSFILEDYLQKVYALKASQSHDLCNYFNVLSKDLFTNISISSL